MSDSPTISSASPADAESREASSPRPHADSTPVRIALIGNPNTGKTTLFNRLSGLRHKTANFPGTTQEARLGQIHLAGTAGPGGAGVPPAAHDPTEWPISATLIDLPGTYSIELDQPEARVCRQVLAGELNIRGEPLQPPDAVCIVTDATNLFRNLHLVGEALRRRLPTVVALNMSDLARKRGLHANLDILKESLGCEVIACSARTGEGLSELRVALARAVVPNRTPPGDQQALEAWAEDIYDRAMAADAPNITDRATDRVDAILTHPIGGIAAFTLIMAGLFWAIFSLATYPMDWIDWIFGTISTAIDASLPPGVLTDLLANGIVAGVGATVIFVPQIALLFFLISLLEDTGYLARAAFVVNRLFQPFGLSGHAFVPFLSSHACALPGIMATRAIPDPRERLAAILVAPFASCTARIPVYVLLTTLLFRHSPALAAAAFVGCYALGATAALLSALIARRTIIKGKARPMVLELPSYKLPSLRTALLTTWDRASVFLKTAGTFILAISIVLWWLGAYPHVPAPQEATQLRAAADAAESRPGTSPFVGGPHVDWQSTTEAEWRSLTLDEARDMADTIESRHAARYSYLGRLGALAQPILAPLGYDRQLSIGVLASFAAREVFVATMAVQVAGRDDVDDSGVFEAVANATRDDGTPIFTTATAWSLLIYYVLAMQCLPTLVVTAREAGGVRWALLQLAWMSGLAYVAAAITYNTLRAFGVT